MTRIADGHNDNDDNDNNHHAVVSSLEADDDIIRGERWTRNGFSSITFRQPHVEANFDLFHLSISKKYRINVRTNMSDG